MASEAVFISVVPHVRFEPGHIVMTCGVAELVQQGRLNPNIYLRRHLGGDWGGLDDSDRRWNDAALQSGEGRLFSAYRIDPNLEVWVITECDHSFTTLLLPSEY